MRVVSLLPSATELLAALGADDLLVGRSHECDHPPRVRDRPILTGQRTVLTDSADIDRQVREALAEGDASSLYTLDTEQLAALRPDVILTQDLCEVCSIDLYTVRGVAARMTPRPTIVSLDPTHLADVVEDVGRVGKAVGRPAAAEVAMNALDARIVRAEAAVPSGSPIPEVAFVEWLSPLFIAGHWTPELIERAGGTHSLNPPGARSVTVTPEHLVASDPDFIILAPCGFGLTETRRDLPLVTEPPWWRDLRAVKAGRVALVDANQMFSRPGPRLVDALEWLVAWLHGVDALMPADFPWEPL